MYAPVKVMMLDQPSKLGKIIGGKVIELAAFEAIANYYLLQEVNLMAVKAKANHAVFRRECSAMRTQLLQF